MAKKTVIIDDLTGETGARTRTFALDGVSYEIDLTDTSLAELRRVLKPYLKVATPTRGAGSAGRGIAPSARPQRRRRSARSDSTSATIRTWARASGLAVPERGRIPATLRAQWEAAGSPDLPV